MNMNRSFLPLVASAVIALILLAAYGMWYHVVAGLSTDAAALSDQIDQKKQDTVRAAAARKALDSIVSDEKTLASRFVAPSDVVAFLGNLQATGQQFGAVVTVGSVSAEQQPHPHLALSLAIKGPFKSVMQTLGTLEYGSQDIEVNTMTLGAVPGDAKGTWSATASVSVGMEGTSTPAAGPVAPVSGT